MMTKLCVFLTATLFFGQTVSAQPVFAMGRPKPEAPIPLNIDLNSRMNKLNAVDQDLIADTWGARYGDNLSAEEFASELHRIVDDVSAYLQVGLGKDALFADQYNYFVRLEHSRAWTRCLSSNDCEQIKSELSDADHELTSHGNTVFDEITQVSSEASARVKEIAESSKSSPDRMALLQNLFGYDGLPAVERAINQLAAQAQDLSSRAKACGPDSRCAMNTTSKGMRQMIGQMWANAKVIKDFRIKAHGEIDKFAGTDLIDRAVDAVTKIPSIRVFESSGTQGLFHWADTANSAEDGDARL